MWELAKEADPHLNRTICVLTKPDTIEKGTEDKWTSKLRGENFRTKLGWWVVKNLNYDQRRKGLLYEDARRIEREFFAAGPWAQFRNRVGVDNLRQMLSRIMGELVDRTFPKLEKQVSDQLKSTVTELEGLPKLGDPEYQCSSLIDQLEPALNTLIHNDYHRGMLEIFSDFKDEVSSFVPQLDSLYQKSRSAQPARTQSSSWFGRTPAKHLNLRTQWSLHGPRARDRWCSKR